MSHHSARKMTLCFLTLEFFHFLHFGHILSIMKQTLFSVQTELLWHCRTLISCLRNSHFSDHVTLWVNARCGNSDNNEFWSDWSHDFRIIRMSLNLSEWNSLSSDILETFLKFKGVDEFHLFISTFLTLQQLPAAVNNMGSTSARNLMVFLSAEHLEEHEPETFPPTN